MKKIMFNSKYGLEQAVLEGRKTMTRRLMKPQPSWVSGDDKMFNDSKPPRYKLGEIVAIAQPYETFMTEKELCEQGLLNSAGSRNSMFVKSSLMPHHIKIAYIKVERLQDISDEDCLREGICQCEACYEAILSKGGVKYAFGDCNRCFKTPREAFAALIDKISGKGTWERNPYCFCYTFKLIK